MAERALATAFVNIVPGTKAMEQYLKGGLGASATSAGGNASAGFAKGFGGKLKGLIGPAFAVAAGVGAAAFVKSAIGAAESAMVADKRLSQVAQSMNIFGTETGAVVSRLNEYASTQSRLLGVDDESIKSTQAKLLTFKELALTAGDVGGAFDRATMAAYDLASAGFGSAESNAIQLGKALNDPIKGMTALSRSGVTFTEVEKARIATLVESNQMGEAQNLILQAIETQVGGTAAATATGSQRMQVAFDELKESVGMALAPAFEKFAVALVPIVDKLAPIMVSLFTELSPIFDMLIGVLDQLMPVMQPLVDVFGLLIAVGIEIIQAVLPPLIDLFIGLMPLISGLGELFAVIVRAILPPLVKLLNDVLIPIILWLADILVTYFIPYWTKLADVLGGVLAVAVDIATRVFKGLMKILEPVWNAVKPLIEGFMSLMGLKPVKLSVGIKTTGTSALPGLKTGKGIDLSKFTGVSTGGGLKTGGSGGTDAKTIAANNKAIKAALTKAGKAVKKAYAKYNEEVASAQADYAKATAKIDKQYNDTVGQLTLTRDNDLASALKDHNANVLAIQKDFANKMADIVQQSKDRLRSAFESVTAVDVGKTFADLATKNADGLISSLREKLLRARELVANAGKLASAGFSQTFIEQVVSQGPDAGNAMAKAILESSPDAQAEIQNLFSDTEKLAGHGMDALADQMYEKSGLANEALRTLYSQAQKDLTDALASEAEAYAFRQTEIQKTFDEGMAAAKVARDEAMAVAEQELNDALAAATRALNESLKAIEDELNTSLKEFKGQLKGHAKEIASIKSDIADARTEAMKPIVITRIENVVVNTSYGSSKNNRIAMAAGGLVTRPTEALIGERGPELVMPLDEFAQLTGRDGNGSTINYYAAPNQSLNAEQALFQAMKRAKVVAAW